MSAEREPEAAAKNGRRKTGQPTMQDVARLAGVSNQTVSRVLNEHPSVKPETRDRILAAIDQLDYRRNRAARALVAQRTFIIGAVAVTPDQYGPSATLVGIERAAGRAGYWVSVVSLQYGRGEDMTQALNHLEEGGVDGIIVITPNHASLQAAALSGRRTPRVVVTSGPAGEYGLVSVDLDNEVGAELAVRHLLELGHSDIAHIAGPSDDFHARVRQTTWRNVLRQADVPVGFTEEGDWTAESGYRAARELLRVKARPTAVFAANDHMALGALRAFHEAGLDVPGDISVVGFDDVSGATNFIPPLTTIRPDHSVLGQAALDALHALIAGEDVPDQRIAPTLVVRESTRKV
ncbi:MAG: LacI family transcriptional regulator [Propionibacteriaceae bacterium]|nr:LacI family transcriptional regulator [Propionibacteriaceae bacterium]